jgi:O-antigen/teichoic acid export membrane protein
VAVRLGSVRRLLPGRRGHRLGLTTVALASSGATTLLFHLVLARRLGPHAFGEVARTYSLGMAVAQITMASISPALSYVVGHGEDDGHRGEMSRSALRIIGVASAVVAVLYLPLALAGFAPTSASSLVLGPLLAFVYALYFGMKLQLFVLDKVMLYAVAELAADVLFVAILALLAWSDPAIGVLTFVVAYGLFVVVMGGYLRARATGSAPIDIRRDVLRYASLSFVGAYSTVARFPLVVGLTGILASSASAGKLAAIFAIVMPLFLVPQAASMLTFATVARSKGEEEHGAVREMTSVVTIFSTAALLACALFAHDIVHIVLGREYLSATTAFVIVALGVAPQLASLPVGNAISAEGSVGLNAAIALLGGPVAIVACLIAIPALGLEGAALGITISHVAMGCALLYFGHRRFRLSMPDLGFAFAVLAVGVAAATLDFPVVARAAILCIASGAVAIRLRAGYIERTSLRTERP